jgi:hypothetical protein
VTGWWFFLGTLVSSTNKTDGHDITEILLKVALKHDKSNTNPLLLHYFLQKMSSELYPFGCIAGFCFVAMNIVKMLQCQY